MSGLLLLFTEFFKTGLFAVGGGLATLPFLYDMAAKFDWFTTSELADMIAVSESTPGPMGVNMATYAGYGAAGIAGGLAATCGLVLPSIIVIILVAKVLDKFNSSKLVKNAFYGLRPAVIGLIAAACTELVKIALLNIGAAGIGIFNIKALALFAVLSALIIKFKKLHPIVFILIGAAAGVLAGGF